MRARSSSRSAFGSPGLWLMSLVVLLLVSGGVGITLWAGGFFDAAQAPSREGQIAYPALVRPVKAYEAITREDILIPQTQQLNLIWLKEGQQNESMLRNLGDIVGRVVARDKSPGYIVTDRDFLAKGTRPGVSAGVPPGKRAVTVAVERVPGLELLRQRDEFDLMAVLPDRTETISNVEQAALLGGIKPPDTRAGQLARQTGVKPLVVSGIVVAHTQGKAQSTGGAQSLVVDPGTNRAKPIAVYATIAVDPEEVTPLTEALGLDVKLFCVARSGHPDSQEEKTPAFSPEGLVSVLATARPVSAYAPVTADDLADAVTGKLNIYFFPADKVDPAWLTGYSEMVGRVLARDVPNGAILSESDLLPKGSRAGLASAAPPGTVVLTIAAGTIEGADQLQRGDRFGLYSRLDDTLRPTLPSTDWASLHGGVLSAEDRRVEQELRTGVRTVTEQGVFLGQTGEQLAIAVPQEEVVRVSQVLSAEQDLFAVVRSTREGERIAEEAERPAPASLGPRADRMSDGANRFLVDVGIDPLAEVQVVDPEARDLVAVPVVVRPVKAYQELQVEDFVDPATGKPRVVYFPKDSAPAQATREIRELLGRVLKRSRRAGEAIFSNDLYPVGTRPGTAAGVPPGWTAIRVTSLEVRGLAMASEGDALDLVAARPIASGALQQAELWPARNQEGTFAQATDADIFTQADVNVLVRDAVVLTREVQDVEVEVRERKESAAEESELGEVITRKSVTRVNTPQFMTRSAVVCSVAVPAAAIPQITEALAVQSIVDDANGDGAPQAEGGTADDGRRIDREVAIFAVLRSSNPESADTASEIPRRDVIADWNRSWARRFLNFLDASVTTAERVQPLEHIRGNARNQEFWLNGRATAAYPREEVVNQTTGRVLRDGMGDNESKP